jgi:PPK2 family polyphosphate:nucleotide phosphotransferase
MMNRKRYRVKSGHAIRLASHDPGDTSGYADKRSAAKKLKDDIARLAKAQDVLSAEARHGLLLIFQGMDTAGKDGAIKHVMSGINPQGVSVYSFKQPTPEESRHDYLWRCQRVMPERGRIGIFNRSYYEDVLVTHVHPELLATVLADPEAVPAGFWKERYEDINAYERYLARNHIHVIKFFLNISKDEQQQRLLKRLDDPRKQWKFSPMDLAQRRYWEQYMHAYERMLEETSSSYAPWYIVPSNHKWFTRVAVADILVAELKSLDLQYPRLAPELRATLSEEKKAIIES